MSRQYAMLVQKSYARCSRSEGFFDDFYDGFIESSDEIREHFAGISRAKQKVFAHIWSLHDTALRHGQCEI